MKKTKVLARWILAGGVCAAVWICPGCSRPVSAPLERIETTVPTEETETEPLVLPTEPPETETVEESEEYPEERVEVDGMIRSYLTGEMVPVSQGCLLYTSRCV